MWTSIVKWPDNTPGFSTVDCITKDVHKTQEAAEYVCEKLRNEGMGLEGKIFPEWTKVEKLEKEQ